MTLGSLFDGSGGFPLAGSINGITPLWASEIEPYPIRVTKARFPNMEHLGSVLDVKGDQITPVGTITFGSPCQDLSVAGKQKGIHEGERSSLFFEAVRIAKEMRAHDRAVGRTGVDVRPRFLVWENVPGAFSSHQGEDFRAVLEALGGIAQDGVSIPRPPKGKWKHAGCVVGDGWSIAWRLYDAQYWGVPQRRKRIYLVADLGSERAGEVLFEPESLRGNFDESREEREGTASHVEGNTGGSPDIRCLNPWDYQSIRQYDINGVYPALSSNATGGLNRQGVCMAAGFKANQGAKARGIGWSEETACTLSSNVAGLEPTVVYDARGNGDGKISPTLTGDHQNRVTDYTALAVLKQGLALSVCNGQLHQTPMSPVMNTLDCMHDQQEILLEGKPPRKYIVRRLTPLECCRLQGFPDWWEDGVEGSDSARYKMWGNGIALPCAVDVLRRIKNEMEE